MQHQFQEICVFIPQHNNEETLLFCELFWNAVLYRAFISHAINFVQLSASARLLVKKKIGVFFFWVSFFQCKKYNNVLFL